MKEYKFKKSKIDAIKIRIEGYEFALNNPEEFIGVCLYKINEPGMPRAKNNFKHSPVERFVNDKEEAIEIIKEWIEEDKSRLYPLELEINQIDAALNSLTSCQRYIVECKYFDNMQWRDIEISFNNNFKQRNDLTVEALRKINNEAKDKLFDILRPFYERFKIA